MSKSSSQDVVSFEDKSVGEVQSSKPVEDIEVKMPNSSSIPFGMNWKRK